LRLRTASGDVASTRKRRTRRSMAPKAWCGIGKAFTLGDTTPTRLPGTPTADRTSKVTDDV
jgi:hypothetical protein